MSFTNAWQVSSANDDNTGFRTGYVLDQEKQEAMAQALESAFHMTGVAQILEYYGFN